MSTVNYIQDMVTRFRVILGAHDRHLECFCRYAIQVEGWLKGELLCFLDSEKVAGRLINFDREVQLDVGRKKIDFHLEIPAGTAILDVWIELKHWLIGYQKGYKLNAQFYFSDPTSVGIKPDVEKLAKIKEGSKYLLILTTVNPGEKEWLDGVIGFNKKYPSLLLKSLTNPADFPQSYFLGLLEAVS